MKKYLAVICLLVSAAVTGRAQVTMNFAFGVLSDATGQAIPDGSLIQIIASPDVTFAAPTELAFTGGNDVIIYSGAMDSAQFQVPGAMQVPLNGVTGVSQYYLEIRWFPTLTVASNAPGVTLYGEFGYADDSNWVAPANGGNQPYSFLTAFLGGTLADTAGQAMLSTAAVPEPSTYAQIALGIGALGLIAYRRRKAA